MRQTIRLWIICSWLLVVILLSCTPAKAIVINQVLYDPINSESGGEAVELYNDEEFDINISNWYITTEKGEKDAVIPDRTTLNSNEYYLITDSGWNISKDNPDWRNGDLEAVITLNNKDSGLILKNSEGQIIDKASWGSVEETPKDFFNGQPAKSVKSGNVLSRINNTGNTFLDFIESIPIFYSNNDIIINIKVEESAHALILEDDSDKNGTQIRPLAGKNKKITLVSSNNELPKIDFLNKSIQATGNKGNWTAKIEIPYWLEPKNYTVSVNQDNVKFELMPLAEFSLDTNKINIDASPGSTSYVKITLKNEGNVPLKIQMNTGDLSNGNTTIVSEKAWKTKTINYDLGVKYTKDINIPFYTPEDLPLGVYKGVIKVIIA